jgi:uncharacterized protein YjdB
MKNQGLITRYQRFLLMIAFLLSYIFCKAYDIEVDGIYYNENTDGTVSVTFKDSNYNSYSGNVNIPNVITYYGDTIPVKSIGLFAFKNCENLINVTIPKSITTIGDFAFQNCTGLKSLDVPNSVSTIKTGAFSGCTGLTSFIIPNGLDSIDSGVFAYCTGISEIVIPGSVKVVGWESFYKCTGLVNVTIPNSVCIIELQAFMGCTSLTSIFIPNSVYSIAGSAFSGCTSLVEMIVANNNPQYDSRDNCNAIIETSSNTLITGCKSTVIPNSITSIGRSAFDGCTGLTNITIPSSVTSIGRFAFSGCTGLTFLTIPSPVTSIGELAFSGCSSLETLNFNAMSCADFSSTTSYGPFHGLNVSTINIGNNVQRIPAYFVPELTNLTSITIPNSVTYIGNGAFQGCSSLTNLNFNAISCTDFSTSPFINTFISTIQIGNDVQKIPANFVKDLTALRTVTIGNSVTNIGNSAFSRCTSMTDVSIGNSVSSIGNSAFYGCTSLTNLSIPASVRTINSKAFYDCSGLESVYSYAENPPVMESSDCFNCYNSSTLYVPYDVLYPYQNTNYWKNFYQICGVDADGNVLVDGITLNTTNLSLNVNQTYKLTATISPDCAANPRIIWSSSNASVATVDSVGFVTAIADGTAIITATTTDGSNLSASCVVTVSSIPVTSISLNKTNLTLDVNETYRLTATVLPYNATNKVVSWSSSNPDVATVSSSGLVTPVAPGSATITATTTDGTNLSASCQVTVVKQIKSLALSESSLTLTLPETAQLTAFITPSDATNPVLNWTSSKPSIATVDSNGHITSVSVGTTTITATTTDGTNLSATCQVTVVKQFVTSITLNESSLVMHIGDTFQLIANVQPENASNPTLSWTTGNSSIVSVDNNGLVSAVSGGTTYVRASAQDGSYCWTNCQIEVIPDYYITLDTLFHIRGTKAQVMDLPVSLINKNPISGIQFDVQLPEYVEFNLINGMIDVELDDARATRSHSISANQLSNGKYRVLVTSSTSKNLKGNDGVLVHMNMLLPQLHETGNYSIYVSNIIASEADETRHTLDNKSTTVHFYYIVGDADANGAVDIADHVATASKILGKSPSPFYYKAANVDGNSSLDVADLVGITNIALEIKPITIKQAPKRGFVENRLFCDRLRLNAGGEQEITVGMDCGFDFAGFQMDVTLPQGLALVDATLGDGASAFGLTTEAMPDGKIRILGTSFSDAEVDGVCPQLLTLKVKADRNYTPDSEIGFSDIIFAERDLTVHSFDSSYVEYVEPSSVYELMEQARIYVEDGNIIVDTPVAGTMQLIAVDGYMVESQAQVGHNVYAVNARGIYIIHFNGKTIKVRL